MFNINTFICKKKKKNRCYEREITLPECSILKIKIMSYNSIGANKLIGETTIDIESRYFSKHRAYCGLPKKYNK